MPCTADFGLATWISNTGYASDASEIGTPYYMAPEYGFRAGYGAPVDVWAVGVMALGEYCSLVACCLAQSAKLLSLPQK
jgi:calcium/calmodulin-dependent protein kinase I